MKKMYLFLAGLVITVGSFLQVAMAENNCEIVHHEVSVFDNSNDYVEYKSISELEQGNETKPGTLDKVMKSVIESGIFTGLIKDTGADFQTRVFQVGKSSLYFSTQQECQQKAIGLGNIESNRQKNKYIQWKYGENEGLVYMGVPVEKINQKFFPCVLVSLEYKKSEDKQSKEIAFRKSRAEGFNILFSTVAQSEDECTRYLSAQMNDWLLDAFVLEGNLHWHIDWKNKVASDLLEGQVEYFWDQDYATGYVGLINKS
ncbi:MAG: hypothetical protein R3A11_08485 [Bdellovibrionota bacterium]